MALGNLKHFVESLQYAKMKKLKSHIISIRNSIGEYQGKQGLKRMEWTDLGLVGIFKRIKLYEKHNDDLFEFFEDHGVLAHVMNIKWVDLSTQERLCVSDLIIPSNSYIKFTPISKFNASNKIYEITRDRSIRSQLMEWKSNKRLYDQLATSWALLRKQIFSYVQENDNNKIGKLSFGKVSLIQPDPTINAVHVQQVLGKDVLRRIGSIDMSKVKQYAAKGFFSYKEIQQIRKIVNTRTTYTLMEIEKEKDLLLMLHELKVRDYRALY